MLIKCEGGVEAALRYAKMWCKYIKELLNWIDKRITYGKYIYFLSTSMLYGNLVGDSDPVILPLIDNILLDFLSNGTIPPGHLEVKETEFCIRVGAQLFFATKTDFQNFDVLILLSRNKLPTLIMDF